MISLALLAGPHWCQTVSLFVKQQPGQQVQGRAVCGCHSRRRIVIQPMLNGIPGLPVNNSLMTSWPGFPLVGNLSGINRVTQELV